MRKFLTFFVFSLSLCAISCTEKEELVIQNTVPVFGRVEAIQDGYKFAFSATISIDNPNNPYYVYGFEVSSSADMADATVVVGKGLGNDGAFTGTYDLVGWKGGDIVYYRAFISRREGEEPLYSETFKVDVPKREYESLKFTSAGKSTIKLENKDGNNPLLYYSYDEFKWTQWDYSELEFTKDKPVYINGDNPKGFSKSYSQYSKFSLSGSPVGCSGSVMTLIDRKNTVDSIPSDYCFASLFINCSLLESAPILPTKTLSKGCYREMFWGAGLKTAPALPAQVLLEECYSGMFHSCSSLQVAPELPATTLADSCYEAMFHSCSSLLVAPKLPATALAFGCYDMMFLRCTSLTSAPELPAITLAAFCYYDMFYGCTSLNSVTCLATDISATSCTNGWLENVASTGTFVKAPSMSDWTRGASGIPEGWDVENSDGSGVVIANKYLTFSSEGTSTIALKNEGDNTPKLYYSYDKTKWKEWGYSSLEFTSSKPLYLCGDNPDGFSHSNNVKSRFVSSGSNFSCRGNIMSLLDYKEEILIIPSDYCFYYLFDGCTNLQTAPELPATTLAGDCFGCMFKGCSTLQTAPKLPATTLAECCYDHMFWGCTSLQMAPELPATTLAEYCYAFMFGSCTSLQTAPELPATTLAELCYFDMFTGCINLQTAPELPATELASSCYSYMFSDCISLQTAPELPATTLARGCYETMFIGCIGLQTAPELPATTLAENCYERMFEGCTSLKTAPNLPATTLAESCYSGMFKGCTSLKNAPELPARTLARFCYYNMFGECQSLNFVRCDAIDKSAILCTDAWLSGVSSKGTFVKSKGMTSWTRGEDGIPYGWTISEK